MKKTGKNLVIAAFGVAVICLAPALAEARKGGGPAMQGYGRGGGGGYGPGPGMGRRTGPGPGRVGPMLNPALLNEIAAELGVDEPTLTKIKSLIDKSNTQHVDQRADTDKARLELHRLMNEDRPDPGKVLRQVEVAGKLETEGRKNRIKLLLDVRALLTDSQQRKLRELMTSRMGRGWEPGPGRGYGPGPGPGAWQD